MPDLRLQLREYVEETIERVDVEDVAATIDGPSPRRRVVRTPAFAFAAAALAFLVVIGGAALLLRGSSSSPAEKVTTTSMLEWTRVRVNEAAFGGKDFVDVRDVTVGGPGLVAVGWGVDIAGAADAMVWTSPDGYTWSRVPHDESVFGTDAEHWEILSAIAGGPGLVAVGGQRPGLGLEGGPAALVWTSPDGTTWTRVAHDPVFDGGGMRDVIEGGPGLVAVGIGGARVPDELWSDTPKSASGWSEAFRSTDPDYGTAAAWTSSDGVSWTRADVPPSDIEHSGIGGVTVGGPGLVAVGVSGDDAAVWTSQDGTVWSRVPHDENVFGGDGIQAMESVTTGGPGLVAVGGDHGRAAVWTSPDGYTWTRVPHDGSVFGGPASTEDQDYPEGHPMRDVIDTGAGLVAVGSGGGRQAVVWTSNDGITWSRVPDPESVFARGNQPSAHHDPKAGMVMRSVTVGGPGLVAVGQDTLAWTAAVWVAEP